MAPRCQNRICSERETIGSANLTALHKNVASKANMRKPSNNIKIQPIHTVIWRKPPAANFIIAPKDAVTPPIMPAPVASHRIHLIKD